MFFKLALRNVFRNKRRTAFSLGVIILGVSILYVVIGFVTDSLQSIEQVFIDLTGSVQIADERVFENITEDFDYLIQPDVYQNILDILNEDPRYLDHTTQLVFSGLVGNSAGSTPLIAIAIVPENPVINFSDYINEGDALSLEPESKQILIDQAMSENLKVGIGDTITIATATVRGAFNASSATIKGIFTINDQTNEGLLGYVNMEYAQRLLKTEGVEQIIVRIEDPRKANEFAAAIQEKLDAQGIALQVRDWKSLSQFYESVRQFWSVFSGFTTIGIFVLVFFSVLEVLTMSFLERVREVGTVRAIGTQRYQLFFMFVIEGAVIGLFGGILGVLFGFGISAIINQASLTWIPPGALNHIDVGIAISWSVALVPFLTAIVSTILSSIYPSWKTARMNIVRALSHS